MGIDDPLDDYFPLATVNSKGKALNVKDDHNNIVAIILMSAIREAKFRRFYPDDTRGIELSGTFGKGLRIRMKLNKFFKDVWLRDCN